MSCPNENRLRSKTVCFRVTNEEEKKIIAKQIISGKAKAEFILEALLNCEIKIVVGKFESDRLSLEIKRLRECLELSCQSNDLILFKEALLECQNLLCELIRISTDMGGDDH